MVEIASQTGNLQIKNGTQSQGGNSFSDRQSTNKQWHSRASFLGQKKWYQNKKTNFGANKKKSLTSDPKITELVTGVKLELNCDDAHLPQSFPSQPSLQAHETTITDREIEKLHEKNVISQCFSVPGQCVLPAFTRLKKRQVSKNDLKFEMFEQWHYFPPFQNGNTPNSTQTDHPGCFMESMDLKDAYCSVPVATEHRKLLWFKWKGQL